MVTEDGHPAVGAGVHSHGALLARVGDDGVAMVELRGSNGEVHSLEIRCPAGYRAPRAVLVVPLTSVTSGARPPRYDATCEKIEHTLVVAFRAPLAAGQPILVLGKEAARLDPSGAAHVVLRGVPGTRFELTLDTGATDLLPKNPVFPVVVRPKDDVTVVDARLDRKKKAPRPGPMPAAGPVRLK